MVVRKHIIFKVKILLLKFYKTNNKEYAKG